MLAQKSPKLSVTAKEFVPQFIHDDNVTLPPKKKKTKEERAAPRRRRRQRKVSSNSFDLDTSDLTQRLNDIEQSSQSSNNSSRRPAYFSPSSSRTANGRETESSTEWSDWINSWMEKHRAQPPTLTSLEAEWHGFSAIDSLDFPSEFASEASERRKWCDWAIHAAEVERRRRIQLLKEMDDYEARERLARRRWAIDAIEKERHERISAQFINNLTTTKWFNETISTYHEDYELVCPYVRLGCRATCRRSTIESHMKQCVFALEVTSRQISTTEYEVVCPNSVLGCTYISNREELALHLLECEFNGKTRQQEIEERQLLKQHVILECEEERLRRLADASHKGASGEGWSSETGDRRKASLHKFMERQMSSVVSQLHDEVLLFWQECCEEHQKRKGFEERFINSLRKKIHRLWPFATVELFGSRATGLPSMSSDMDVVVCFNDQYADLPSITGVIPLLQALTAFLEKEASDVLLHTRVPLIKAEAHRSLRTAAGGDWGAVAVDISIDSPAHSGLAASAMVNTILTAFPGIGPVASIIKHYLKNKVNMDRQLWFNMIRYGLSGSYNRNPHTPTRTPVDSGTLSPISTMSPPTKADIAKAMVRTDQQREYGKRVALRLLGCEDGTTLSTVEIKSPMLGVMLVEFMSFYGDHFEKYGFSVRQGGFSFDILAAGVPAHPQADHPMLIEDPVNVMNNVAINTFQAGAVQRAFQAANEQFKLLVVRYSSKGQHRGAMIAEMLHLAPMEMSADGTAKPRRRLNPQLVKEMEQKHHRDRQRDLKDGEFKTVLNDLLQKTTEKRPQRRMSASHANDVMMQRFSRGSNSPRKHKRGSSCHSI